MSASFSSFLFFYLCLLIYFYSLFHSRFLSFVLSALPNNFFSLCVPCFPFSVSLILADRLTKTRATLAFNLLADNFLSPSLSQSLSPSLSLSLVMTYVLTHRLSLSPTSLSLSHSISFLRHVLWIRASDSGAPSQVSWLAQTSTLPDLAV